LTTDQCVTTGSGAELGSVMPATAELSQHTLELIDSVNHKPELEVVGFAFTTTPSFSSAVRR
jgi:hypothetical protein